MDRQPIRILLVDDHALFRESVGRLLTSEVGFEVSGCCGTVDEAVALLHQKQIDIVLLDFDLGHRDGAQFMRLAQDMGFKGKILIVTAGVEQREAAELIYLGVSGIFMKHNSPDLLAQGIRDVIAGKVWFDQKLFASAMKIGTASFSKPQSTQLTQREREILSCVFEGMTNKEIGARMGVSESLIKGALQQLFSKTGVHTRGQLVRIALEQYKSQL